MRSGFWSVEPCLLSAIADVTIAKMTERKHHGSHLLVFLFLAAFLCKERMTRAARPRHVTCSANDFPAPLEARTEKQDDSTIWSPAKDLHLKPEGDIRPMPLPILSKESRLEENGEMEKALDAYRKVLNVDPGQAQLATRVAALLSRQEDFPQAIDVLKDAIKANPTASEPGMQLAFIYAKYLKKSDQALEYANRAVELDPRNIETYQRLYEIEITTGNEKKAREALDRAAKVKSNDPAFWSRLGKLYASIVFKQDREPKPEDLARVNGFFKKAADHAGDDPATLKGRGRLLRIFPSDQGGYSALYQGSRIAARRCECAGKAGCRISITNQRDKAIEMLNEIIKLRPERYQPYELLAQLYEDNARVLDRANQKENAKAEFAKAAANYEQSLLINPGRATPTLRLAQLLIASVRDSERAVKVLTEGRRRFPGSPEFTYLLASRFAKQNIPSRRSLLLKRHCMKGRSTDSEVVNARFYFDYA